MAALSAATVLAPAPQTSPAWLEDSPAAEASIARYNQAAERMLRISDLTWKLCVALFVLVAAAWLLGVLPGAVRLV